MDLLLNYQTDRNNGLSLIKSFTEFPILSWGVPSESTSYVCLAPECITPGMWKIIIYKNTQTNQFISYQLIDVTEFCSGMPIRTAITDVQYTILALLNNHTNAVYIYTFNEFEQFQYTQTILLPHTNADVDRISIYNNYMIISDYTYDNGGSRLGAIFIYEWNPINKQFVYHSKLENPEIGDNWFGYSICIRESTIFVGAPYKTTNVSRAGAVYIYDKVGSSWTLSTTIIGPAFIGGCFGWSLHAFMDSSISEYRVIIGNPGANDAKGRVYFYHRVGAIWELRTMLQAPISYQQNGNRFGNNVSIRKDDAIISAIGELSGQGTVYLYLYNSPNWALATDNLDNPARFTQDGATEYGKYVLMGHLISMMTFINNSSPHIDVYTKTPLNTWMNSTYYKLDSLLIKNTVDTSFYHLASGNQTIIFKLESPIVGNFRVQLDMDDALMTIGPQNNKIYFVENNIYKIAELEYGNYTGNQLATYVTERMNLLSEWSNNYNFAYNAIANKFTVSSQYPFTFGSNLPDSLKDSCQNKTMGFYDNNNSVVHINYSSDEEAVLNPPSQIGVNIVEGYPILPGRNNCIFSEHGLRATLINGRYRILASDNMCIHIPRRVTQVTFVFPCIDGGTFLNVNTNDIIARLTNF